MRQRALAIFAALALGVGLTAAVGVTPAAADTAPADPNEPATVSADPLPTAQINGVAWAQVVVGNKVFVGGSFSNARPAGSPAGTNTVPRANLMAYDITTGVMDPNFKPVLDGQVLAMAVSPDKSTLYVGGDFQKVDGQWHVRVAAFNTATGQIKANFRAVAGSTVRALAATNDTLYFGGDFTAVANAPGVATVSRPFLAAASASTGAIQPWSPSPNSSVTAMTMNGDLSKVVVGGRFTTVGGADWYGMAAVDPSSGAPLPWAATSVLRNAGTAASWTSLRSTPDGVYGTGYVFGSGGNFEGTFRVDNTTGQITWLADCHGDHYSAYPFNGAVYTTSHAHYCGNFGGLPQNDPWTMHWAGALLDRATTTLTADIYGYASFTGQPAPSELPWYPTFLPGSYTTSRQAGWSTEGNGQYVAVGGEFIAVNGGAQQGLTRFAVPGIAPKKVRPAAAASLVPALSSHAPGEVRIGWQATHDRDNRALTYKVYRNFTGINNTPVHQTTVNSLFYQRPSISFTDKELTPGATVQYRIAAFDANNNYVLGDPATVVVTGDTTGQDYRRAVFADSPSAYFPLDSVPGDGRLQDLAGSDTSVSAGGVSANPTGALQNSSRGSASFNGSSSNGYSVGEASQVPPNTFTVEAWVRTTSSSGGRIVGYSSRRNGPSNTSTSIADRHLYMDNAGRVHFGVNNGSRRVVSSSASFNDGNWHQVVGSMGSNGMRLYVDGKFIGSREDVTSGRRYGGYWRIGGDNLSSWTNAPSSHYLNGSIDEVAVYPTVLSRKQVDAHYVASGRPSQVTVAPADAYGAMVHEWDPELYWRMENTSGTTSPDSGMAGTPGTITGGVTLNQAGALFPTPGKAYSFNGSNGLVVAQKQTIHPQQFTAGVWFKTTTTRGGKLIGFGDAASGLSSNYDRHLYMQDDGRLVFGIYDGQTRTLVSPGALNDGAWHMAVGTVGPEGMRLYIDGQQVGSNTFNVAQNYTGRWRIGGDRTWGSTSSYFNGVLDEAMVLSRPLTAAEVSALRLTGIEPPPNQQPTSSFTATSDWMDVTVNGSGSSDPDGTITSYAWDFGDGTTDTGATPPTHTYANPGNYTVRLTVTDNSGATASTTQSVEAKVKPNQLPTALFTVEQDFMKVTVDGSQSSDSDGSIASYAWEFGDGDTAQGVTPPAHTYDTPGNYTISLTVTDNKGGTATKTEQVTVSEKPNVEPTAAFGVSANALVVSVNGSGSSDEDGTITDYAWDFGDGGTASGAIPADHTYAAPGTYSISLTVTDNKNATDTLVRQVTVSSVLASDLFARSVASGWGAADKGGNWSACNATCNSLFSVVNGAGQVSVRAGSGPEINLPGVSSTSTDMQVEVTVDRAATGGGSYAATVLRGDYRNGYRAKARIQTDGSVQLVIVKVVNGTETVISPYTKLPAGTFVAGDTLVLRGQAVGTSPTQLKFKVWEKGTAEPADWQLSVTDSTAGMQQAGGIGLWSFLSGSSTNGPAVYRYDNLTVRSAN